MRKHSDESLLSCVRFLWSSACFDCVVISDALQPVALHCFLLCICGDLMSYCLRWSRDTYYMIRSDKR
jgi:hypothetical protein